MTYQLLIDNLTTLKNTSKTSEKEALLLAIGQDPLTKRVLNFLADDFQIVGISTKKLQKELPLVPNNLTLEQVIDYLLAHPTGLDADIQVVQGFLASQPEAHREALGQMITKTWTTTVGAKMLNKVFGKQFVPEFGVQLAYPYDKKIQQYTDEDQFYVTQKLDGHRALVIAKPSLNAQGQPLYTIDSLTVTSRKGKPVDYVTELKEDVLAFIHMNSMLANAATGFVLDGELLIQDKDNTMTSGERFQKTGQLISSNEESQGLEYHIFDLVTLPEFEAGKSQHPYSDRRDLVLNQLTETDTIRVVPVLFVITKDRIPEWAAYATNKGWEGVMLNAANGFYQTKRTKDLLKVKQMHTADLQIVGFMQSIDGQYAGSLQSLVMRIDDENTVLVGSGLSVELRDHIWNNQDQYLGVMAEIQYFEETINKKGERSLRFPVFKTFRHDKTVDDTNIE